MMEDRGGFPGGQKHSHNQQGASKTRRDGLPCLLVCEVMLGLGEGRLMTGSVAAGPAPMLAEPKADPGLDCKPNPAGRLVVL